MALTKDQRNHLLARIAAAHLALQYPARREPPARVVAAKRVVEEYEAGEKKLRAARTEKLNKAIEAAREAVEFAVSADAALKVVKALKALRLP